MLSFDYSNLSKITAEHGLKDNEISAKFPVLRDYLQKIHARRQGFYEIPDDEKTLEKIEKFAQAVKGKYIHIVVLGIGGSALGPICLHEALMHSFENQLINNPPHLNIIDNIDPDYLNDLQDAIGFDKTLFIVVSKSGSTTETLTQYFYFRKKIEEANLNPKEHFVFITDEKIGLLREIANNEQITTFEIPENVGGRFSVLTAVGLLPAALKGINIRKLIEGAKKERENFLSEDPKKNLAFKLAAIQFLLGEKGKSICVTMPYSQKLFRLADWYRQLLAESIGKKHDREGKLVNVGITPVNALGVTDQHSQAQLYNEGPNDKLIIFLEVENFHHELTIPNPYPDRPEFAFFAKGPTFNKLINIEKKATEMSLTENDRPNITIKLNSVTEESLGELFMLFQAEIAFLGEFYNIDAFDQPGVELSKKLTKDLLSKEYGTT